jgi:hypothetical protein
MPVVQSAAMRDFAYIPGGTADAVTEAMSRAAPILQTRDLLLFTLLVSLLVVACGSTGNDSNEGGDSAACKGTPPVTCDGCCGSKYPADRCLNGAWACTPLTGSCVLCDAGTDAAADDSGTCTGTPPVTCDGCCGIKYPADQCVNGGWTCAPRGGGACIQCDAGVDAASGDASSDSGTCTGAAPSCFGNNSSACCGQDPSGSAVCSGGAWMCGSVPAPGCNGTSCLLRDAGPG